MLLSIPRKERLVGTVSLPALGIMLSKELSGPVAPAAAVPDASGLVRDVLRSLLEGNRRRPETARIAVEGGLAA